MVANRLRAAGEPVVFNEEGKLLQPPVDLVKNSIIALEPQRIRTFLVTYHQARVNKRHQEWLQKRREEEERLRQE